MYKEGRAIDFAKGTAGSISCRTLLPGAYGDFQYILSCLLVGELKNTIDDLLQHIMTTFQKTVVLRKRTNISYAILKT